MRKSLIVFLIALSSMGFTRTPEVSKNTFLFCLKKDIPLLQIDSKNNRVTVDIPELNSFFDQNGIYNIERWLPYANEMDYDGDIFLNRIYRVYISDTYKSQTNNIIEKIADFSFIEYSENEFIRRPFYRPNDTNLSNQCSIEAVGADKAWDFWNIPAGIMPGSREVILVSVDTGVDYTHPDLWKNIWINQGEIPSWMLEDNALDSNNNGKVTPEEIVNFLEDNSGDVNNDGEINLRDLLHSNSPFTNGFDDDNNGYSDDFIGWDPSGMYGADDNDPFPREDASVNGTWAHGTHVAGILGATTDNNLGMASTAFNASIMSVKAARSSQSTDPGVNDGYSGILYAAKAGYYAGTFSIINNSWGGGGFSSSENSTINTAYNTYGAIILSSTGNDDVNSAEYPASYSNCISVAAIGCSGEWGGWATYHSTVEFSAPGESIYSTIIGSGYESWDGSSMSCPNAASCFGLMKSFYPNWTNEELRERMQQTADPIIYEINDQAEYAGNLGYGMIDVHKAIGSLTFPYLSIDTLTFTDTSGDFDGVLNPGESASLNVNLKNAIGWQPAFNLQAQLSCENDLITIINGTSSYPNIFANNSASNNSQFTLSFSSNLEVGVQTCELEISGIGNDNLDYNTSLLIDIPISLHQSGFPIAVGSQLKPSPVVVDFDGDGTLDILTGDYNGLVHWYRADGTEVVNDIYPFDTGNQIWGSPSADDFDNDGHIDIAVTSKSKFIYILDQFGVKADYDANSWLMGSPAVGQLDDDDDLEVVIGGYSSSGKMIYAINHDGTDVSGFPVDVNERMIKGVALFDFNGNGKDDIIFVSDSDNISLLLDDGTISWSFTTGDKVQSAPSIINTGNEILICAGSKDDSLYCLTENGDLKFSYPTGNYVYTSPSFVEYNNEVGIFFGSDDGNIYGVDINGNDLPGWPQQTDGSIVGSIAFSDMNNDGNPEVISTNASGQLLSYNLDGSLNQYFPISTEFPYAGSPHISDLDGDGDLEIFSGSTNTFIVTDIKTQGSVEGYWNTYRGNLRRTGYYDYSGGESTCTSGDLDDNGIIDILDIVQTVNIVMGNSEASTIQACAADINNDDIIDVLDIVLMVNIVLGNN